jgi:hypothetical protein
MPMAEQVASTVIMPILNRNTASNAPSVRIREGTFAELSIGTSIHPKPSSLDKFYKSHVEREPDREVENDADYCRRDGCQCGAQGVLGREVAQPSQSPSRSLQQARLHLQPTRRELDS